jgi:uncharacterized membrane protein YkoI
MIAAFGGRIMRLLRVAAFLSCGLSGFASAQKPDEVVETKTTLEQMPAAVQAAVKAQGQGATLRGLAKEMKDGVAFYEASMTVDGRTKDILFDEQGKIVTLEEQKTLGEIPAGARGAIQKAVGAGKLIMVEKVTQGERTFYEGHVTTAGKTTEVKVDAEGKTVE